MKTIISYSLSCTLQTLWHTEQCEISRLLIASERKTRYRAPDGPNYLAFREKDGLMSYLPHGRTHQVTDEGKWLRAGRQDGKPAKIARQVLHPRIVARLKDKDWQKFSALFEREDKRGQLRLERSDWETAYAKHEHATGSLGQSCMAGDPVGEFYSLFSCYPLVCFDGLDRVVGRAVIWENTSADQIIMDRVYSNSDSGAIEALFFEHAKSSGWWRKTRQSFTSKREFTLPDGSEDYADVFVSPPNAVALSQCEYFPYMDTFTYRDDDGDLRNYGKIDATHIHDKTDGSVETVNDHEGEVQDIDGHWIDEDEAYTVDGDVYHQDDDRICYCERSEEYCLRSECYAVEISRCETRYIHESYVSRA